MGHARFSSGSNTLERKAAVLFAGLEDDVPDQNV